MKKLILYAVCVAVQCLSINVIAAGNALRAHLGLAPRWTWPAWLILALTITVFALQFAKVWKTADRANSAERRELLREIERAERGR